jgi:hypothetical protein
MLDGLYLNLFSATTEVTSTGWQPKPHGRAAAAGGLPAAAKGPGT